MIYIPNGYLRDFDSILVRVLSVSDRFRITDMKQKTEIKLRTEMKQKVMVFL